jgi:hypothetical protein
MYTMTCSCLCDCIEDTTDIDTYLCSECKVGDHPQDLVTLPDSVPNYIEQLFTLSEEMLKADLIDWAVEVRVIANSLAEGLNYIFVKHQQGESS